MNLVNDPWIPVVMQDGAPGRVSLRDVFEKGEDIADLAANPCQRIALMRLLICVAQAALDGPRDEDDWRDCKPRMAPAALSYLDKRKDRFNLFGEHAFLQVDGLQYPDDSFADKPLRTLDATSANGGTGLSMLWDHVAGKDIGSMAIHEIPIYALCYVNFSCSGKVGKAQWRDVLFNGPTAAAPSHDYLHTYIVGKTISDTIYCNLCSKDKVSTLVTIGESNMWGCPIWERMPNSPVDDDALRNASKTYLGRLVPLSRLISFVETAAGIKCMAGPPPDELRMNRLPFFREPAATVVMSKKDNQPLYLKATAGRHIWRDLESIFVTGKEGGALSLIPFLNTYVYPQAIDHFRVWIGGSVKGNNEGKYDDLVEWSSDLSASCFSDGILTAYRKGMMSANIAEKSLIDAIRKYSRPEKDKPDKDSKQMPLDRAKVLFWNSLDCVFDVLLNAVEKDTLDAVNDWDEQIHSALRAAYDRTCPHETPRQIQAYAQGLKVLQSWKKERDRHGT